MNNQGDTKRPRSVKAKFDNDFNATSNAGAVLVEKTLRALNLRRVVKDQLSARNQQAKFSMENAVHAFLAALLVGGKGIRATEKLREDALLSDIFGLENGAPSPSTLYRLLCELSGLKERKSEECYVPNGRALPALDMFGSERRRMPVRRRLVPRQPEAAAHKERQALDAFTSAVAVKCARAIKRNTMRLRDWYVVFGDASDLEVEGNCFDAARMGRDGKKIIRWQTLTLGPIFIAQALREGNTDEGLSMPELFEQGAQTVRKALGGGRRILALLDAAYFEKQVVDPLASKKNWDFIICANQQRNSLRRLAEEQPQSVWQNTGSDARRAWSRSEVCCFTHWPKDWKQPVTIVTRRWIKDGDLDGVWHYSFLGTRIAPGSLPKKLEKQHGYCSTLWMLYGTKQGRENHYKTPLRDFGLHHPPSCRLGVNQAFYTLATAASNVAMVMRYRVVAKEDQGIAFWRLRERYFQISGFLVKSARRLTVHLSGVNTGARRQVLWEQAFASAGRL